MNYQWDFRVAWVYREAFVKGTILTLELTVLTIFFGSIIGLILAFGRLSNTPILRITSIAYIELFRAIPLLVLLIWIYYCIPPITGLKISGFTAGVIGLSINLSAFAAETIRAGIESIPKGQTEAARALGMSYYQTMRRIVLPQAVRIMIPPLVSLYITMLKLSSLASVIAVYELLHSAQNLISLTYRPLEIYSVVAVIYVLLVLPGTYLSKRLEISALFKKS